MASLEQLDAEPAGEQHPQRAVALARALAASGECERVLGQLDAAARTLDRARQLATSHRDAGLVPAIHFSLAKLAHQRGKRSVAIQHVRVALVNAPPGARVRIGSWMRKANRRSEKTKAEARKPRTPRR
jgi:hypothetical protein